MKILIDRKTGEEISRENTGKPEIDYTVAIQFLATVLETPVETKDSTKPNI